MCDMISRKVKSVGPHPTQAGYSIVHTALASLFDVFSKGSLNLGSNNSATAVAPASASTEIFSTQSQVQPLETGFHVSFSFGALSAKLGVGDLLALQEDRGPGTCTLKPIVEIQPHLHMSLEWELLSLSPYFDWHVWNYGDGYADFGFDYSQGVPFAAEELKIDINKVLAKGFDMLKLADLTVGTFAIGPTLWSIYFVPEIKLEVKAACPFFQADMGFKARYPICVDTGISTRASYPGGASLGQVQVCAIITFNVTQYGTVLSQLGSTACSIPHIAACSGCVRSVAASVCMSVLSGMSRCGKRTHNQLLMCSAYSRPWHSCSGPCGSAQSLSSLQSFLFPLHALCMPGAFWLCFMSAACLGLLMVGAFCGVRHHLYKATKGRQWCVFMLLGQVLFCSCVSFPSGLASPPWWMFESVRRPSLGRQEWQ